MQHGNLGGYIGILGILGMFRRREASRRVAMAHAFGTNQGILFCVRISPAGVSDLQPRAMPAAHVPVCPHNSPYLYQYRKKTKNALPRSYRSHGVILDKMKLGAGVKLSAWFGSYK
jgi:hypothetical protein